VYPSPFVKVYEFFPEYFDKTREPFGSSFLFDPYLQYSGFSLRKWLY